MTILDKNTEISLLQQQLETLKQELYCECQLTKLYSEELKDTKRELKCLEYKLNTVLTSEMLELEQAKELAQLIFKKKMPVNQSLATLLSAIYNSKIKLGELAQTDKRLRFKIKPTRRSDRLTASVIKLKVPNNFQAQSERFRGQVFSVSFH